jgi:hypothetical protein
MREDIAAIEACNNTLELQARNNAKLLSTLQGLVSDLALDQETTWLLENPSFSGDRWARAGRRACVWLAGRCLGSGRGRQRRYFGSWTVLPCKPALVQA